MAAVDIRTIFALCSPHPFNLSTAAAADLVQQDGVLIENKRIILGIYMADGGLELTLKLLGLAKPTVLKPRRTKILLLFAAGRPSAWE
ncbi:MAG TPA: hypothetical protein VK638_19305 [Edaphobacter sp.]|nr:hypothetical protein [Edaphobacter sp.]